MGWKLQSRLTPTAFTQPVLTWPSPKSCGLKSKRRIQQNAKALLQSLTEFKCEKSKALLQTFTVSVHRQMHHTLHIFSPCDFCKHVFYLDMKLQSCRKSHGWRLHVAPKVKLAPIASVTYSQQKSCLPLGCSDPKPQNEKRINLAMLANQHYHQLGSAMHHHDQWLLLQLLHP